jgi:hypothetical protein
MVLIRLPRNLGGDTAVTQQRPAGLVPVLVVRVRGFRQRLPATRTQIRLIGGQGQRQIPVLISPFRVSLSPHLPQRTVMAVGGNPFPAEEDGRRHTPRLRCLHQPPETRIGSDPIGELGQAMTALWFGAT